MSWKRVKRVVEFVLGVVKEARKEAKGPGVSRSQALSCASIPIGAHTAKWTGGLFFSSFYLVHLCITVL